MKLRHAAWLLAAVSLAGCSGGSDSRDRQVPPGTITIGFPNDVRHDPELSNGAKIAARQINGLGGIDGALKIRLLVRDTGGDPKRGGRLATRLIEDGARVLILPCDVGSQRAIVRAARGKRLLLLGTCNYDPALVDRTPFFWAVGVGANVEAAALADYAHNQGYGSVHLTVPATADGRRLAHYFALAARQRGIDVSPNAAHADAILGTDLADSRRAVHHEGLVFATFGYPDPGFATDEFYERYRSYYGVRPDSSRSVLAYSALKLLERAVNRAEAAGLGPVTHELRGLQWESPLGHVTYPDSGGRNPETKVALVQVKDGRLAPLTRAAPGEVPAP